MTKVNAQNIKELLETYKDRTGYGINIIGPVGVGKHSIIEAAAREINDNIIIIQCGLVIDNELYDFDEANIKDAIVLLHEFNCLSSYTQSKVFRLMEKYQNETMFITTCNVGDKFGMNQFILDRLVHFQWEV